MVKNVLSKSLQLKVLNGYPSGNMLTRGGVIPKQIMWARLVVGTMKGLDGEGRWRGPVASAVYSVAQQNYDQWRDDVDRTALHRHVYTVSRR